MLLPKLGGFWLLPPRDFPQQSNESHPMDHDSNSSGHAIIKCLTPIDARALTLTPPRLASHSVHFSSDVFKRHFLLRNSFRYLRGL